jgi:hypothetical protein
MRSVTPITRDNIDDLLNSNRIECLVEPGSRWWIIRRNGKTRIGAKGNPNAIRIPVRTGEAVYAAITEADFTGTELDPNRFRVVPQKEV